MRQLAWAIFQLFIGYVTILAMDGVVMPPSQQIMIVVGSAFCFSCFLALLIDITKSLLRRAMGGEQEPREFLRREPQLWPTGSDWSSPVGNDAGEFVKRPLR